MCIPCFVRCLRIGGVWGLHSSIDFHKVSTVVHARVEFIPCFMLQFESGIEYKHQRNLFEFSFGSIAKIRRKQVNIISTICNWTLYLLREHTHAIGLIRRSEVYLPYSLGRYMRCMHWNESRTFIHVVCVSYRSLIWSSSIAVICRTSAIKFHYLQSIYGMYSFSKQNSNVEICRRLKLHAENVAYMLAISPLSCVVIHVFLMFPRHRN